MQTGWVLLKLFLILLQVSRIRENRHSYSNRLRYYLFLHNLSWTALWVLFIFQVSWLWSVIKLISRISACLFEGLLHIKTRMLWYFNVNQPNLLIRKHAKLRFVIHLSYPIINKLDMWKLIRFLIKQSFINASTYIKIFIEKFDLRLSVDYVLPLSC